jgi:hypothetical protein
MNPLEDKIAAIIAEHVEIGYELRPDGLVDPSTIGVTGAHGAAHMVIHELSKAPTEHPIEG